MFILCTYLGLSLGEGVVFYIASILIMPFINCCKCPMYFAMLLLLSLFIHYTQFSFQSESYRRDFPLSHGSNALVGICSSKINKYEQKEAIRELSPSETGKMTIKIDLFQWFIFFIRCYDF